MTDSTRHMRAASSIPSAAPAASELNSKRAMIVGGQAIAAAGMGVADPVCYATFSQRAGAIFIDAALVSLLCDHLWRDSWLAWFGVWIGYTAVSHSIWGRTAGKLLFGLNVQKHGSAEKLGLVQSFIRSCGQLLDLALGFGLLSARRGPSFQSSHDRWVDTVVTAKGQGSAIWTFLAAIVWIGVSLSPLIWPDEQTTELLKSLQTARQQLQQGVIPVIPGQ